MSDWSNAGSMVTAEMVRYEMQRYGATVYFSPEALDAMGVEAVRRHASQDLAFRVTGLVATWRQERLLEVPADWWQHFKQRWLPTFMRWGIVGPVLTRTYDAAVILPRVPVVNREWHTAEFPVWQPAPEAD